MRVHDFGVVEFLQGQTLSDLQSAEMPEGARAAWGARIRTTEGSNRMIEGRAPEEWCTAAGGRAGRKEDGSAADALCRPHLAISTTIGKTETL